MAFLSSYKEVFSSYNFRPLLLTSGAVVASVYMARLLLRSRRRILDSKRRYQVQEERKQKFAALERKLEGEIDERKVDEIVSLPLGVLAERLKAGDLKPTEVLRAYQWRALAAHKKTNCLVTYIEEAMEWAIQLEEDEGRRGILYGVPVSIKEHLCAKGYSDSEGVTRGLDNIPDEDSLSVEILKSQGAIPFVITNFPQTYIALESENPIYGAVTHPRDATRTAGGSSGGEGALLACGGSPLGFGSDIGGSVRIPAHFCGVCGLKPTADRLTAKGEQFCGQTVLLSSNGPLSRDVDGLALALKSLLVPAMFENDSRIIPLPFQNDIYQSTSKLRIGYYVDDGFYPASPPCARAVMVAKEVLEKRGHTLVPWTPTGAEFSQHAWWKCLMGDQGNWWRWVVGEDPVDQCIKFHFDCVAMPRLVRKFNTWLARRRGHTRYADHLDACAGTTSVSDWWTWTEEVENNFRVDFEDDWNDHELDAVICPAAVTPAPRAGDGSEPLLSLASYVILYNMINYPAGTLPVTTVTREDIANTQDFAPGDPLDAWVRRTVSEAEGLPVGVQCVAPGWQEELCLRVMKEVEQGLREQA